MKLNDSSKTIGSVIAVLLIPLAVIGWNFYNSRNSENENGKLNVADVEKSSDNETKGNDTTSKGTVQTTPSPTPKVKGTTTGNGIGGVKTLPNTSRHPKADD